MANTNDNNEQEVVQGMTNSKSALEKQDEERMANEQIRALLKRKKLRLDISGSGAVIHSAPASPTANISVMDLTWDEDEATSREVKRSKDTKDTGKTEPEKGPATMATKLRRVIKAFDRESREASRWVEKNTRSQLKVSVANLRSLASQLMTQEAQTVLQTMGGKAASGEEGEVAEPGQHQETLGKLAQAREEIAKLEAENKKLKSKIEELMEKSKIEEDPRVKAALEGEKTFASLQEIIDLPWRNERYVKTALH